MLGLLLVLVALALPFVVIVSMAMARAVVLSTLWGWFVVPFFGLPAISLPLAAGLLLVVEFLLPSGSQRVQDTSKLAEAQAAFNKMPEGKAKQAEGFRVIGMAFGSLITTLFGYLLTLGFGWVVRSFL